MALGMASIHNGLFVILAFFVGTSVQLQCDVTGFCIGSSIGVYPSVTHEECVSGCTDLDTCNAYTYDSADGFCTLFSSCTAVDSNCNTCLSGEKACAVKDILFIVGGIPGGASVEAIDLTNPSASCEVVPDYPEYVYNHVSGTYKGQPVVCGDSTPKVDCFLYEPSGPEWLPFYENMTEARAHAFGAQLSEVEFVIMGGGQVDQSTTDHFVEETQSFTNTFQLPFNLTYACSGMINETHLFVSGGYANSLTITDSLIFYDIPKNEWSVMPTMDTARYYHGCGVAYTNNGPEIVVTGGSSSIQTTEVFNIAISSWRYGPDLPEGNRGMATAQYEDSFLLTGGIALSERNKLFQYDWENEEWMLLPQVMQNQRYGHTAVLVNRDIVKCS